MVVVLPSEPVAAELPPGTRAYLRAVVDPELLGLAAVDFEDFHVKHDFRRSPVVGGDQVFDHLQGFAGVRAFAACSARYWPPGS